MVGRHRREIVERLVHACRQARGCHVVAQNALICDVGEETRLRRQLADQMRNILLAFRGKRFLVARPSAEGYDDYFPFLAGSLRAHKRARAHQGRSHGHARPAQELAAA